MIITAIIVCVLLFLLIIFQLLLAIGLPFGRFAYGGKYEKLPNNLRIMSLIAVGIFIFGIIIVLERATIITILNNELFTTIVVWIFAVYLTLNTLMNAASKSQREKRIMTPISFVIAVCCYTLAIVG
ncbi:MAG: hypothetical protein KGD58_14425 [Candidatus Lokiarchaeota archaeon]|nr:hypothetical protein [Candidatus Lokiarchaeota archaeon]